MTHRRRKIRIRSTGHSRNSFRFSEYTRSVPVADGDAATKHAR